MTTSQKEAQKVFERSLGTMVHTLTSEGRQVIIVKQVPEQLYFDQRQAFYKAVLAPGINPVQPVEKETNAKYQQKANAAIDGLSAIPGVTIIDPTSILCARGGICDLERGGELLYRDENHLSVAGALALEPVFRGVFETMRPSR